VEIAIEYTDDNEEEEDEDDDEEDDEDDDENEDEGDVTEEGEAHMHRRPIILSREEILRLLGHAGLGRIFATGFTPRSALQRRPFDDDDDDEEEDEEEDDSDPGTGYDPIGPAGTSGRRRRPRGANLFEKVPSEQGQELMQTGTFGSNVRNVDTIQRKKKLASAIMRRELGLGSDGRQKNATRLLKQGMIPESAADTIIHYNARCYSGQFSDDGNFFFSCAQDFKVRMYDTSNPYDWKYYKASNTSRLCFHKADSL